MNRKVLLLPGHKPAVGHAPALKVAGASRLMFVSGQVPVAPDGNVPAGIDAQTRQVWANLVALLAEADMTLDNLTKVTVFLSDRELRAAVNRVSDDLMDGRLVAWTTVIAGMLREEWLLEIEAVAVA